MSILPSVISSYLNPEHLSVDKRIPASILIRVYLVSALSNMLLISLGLADMTSAREVYFSIIRILILLAFFAATELTRRGYLKAGGFIVSTFLCLGAFNAMYQNGGLAAMSCLALGPLVILCFFNAKREILLTGAFLIVSFLGVHLWLRSQPATTSLSPIYESNISMMSFTIIVVVTTLVMYMCAQTNQAAIAEIQRSTAQLEEAQRQERARRIEAEQARQQAALTQQAKSRFLANMSHELRTPLNAILGYSEIIDEELEVHASLPQIYRQDTSRIQRAGRRLLYLINDILDLSRIEAERMPMQPEDLDLVDVLNGALEIARERHPKLAIVPHWDPEESITVWGDASRAQQLVAQLILLASNAGEVHVDVLDNDEGPEDRIGISILAKEITDMVSTQSLTATSSAPIIELRQSLQNAIVDVLHAGLERDDDERIWHLYFRRDAPATVADDAHSSPSNNAASPSV